MHISIFLRLPQLAIRALAAVLALLLPLTLAAQEERIRLPDLGASAGNVIPLAVEKAFARALIQQMREYGVLLEDPQIASYFSDMGYRLVARSDEPGRDFTFVVIKDNSINAFAAPGGVIALHTGMILLAERESEVAGVLGHEIAHITQKHTARAIEQAQAMSIPMMLAMLGLIFAGGGSGEAVQAAVIGTQAAAVQAQINYTRSNEFEADRIGIRTLAAAGYEPLGMASMFEKMNSASRGLGRMVPEYLRTHPVTTTRIAEAKNRAALMGTSSFKQSADFYLIRARLRALTEPRPEDAMRYFEHALDRGLEPYPDALRYGESVALLRQRKFDEALAIAEALVAAAPRNLSYRIQMAEAQLASGRQDAALAELARLHYQFPGNVAVTFHYSDALLSTGDVGHAAEAGGLLRQYLVTQGGHAQLYELYARAANRAGDSVRASEAMAESFYLRGQLGDAIYQLEQLARRDDLDYYQRARISSRLSQMKVEFAQYMAQHG